MSSRRRRTRACTRPRRRTRARIPFVDALADFGKSLLALMAVSRFNSIYNRMASSLGIRREDSSSPPTKLRLLPSQNLQAFRNRFKRHSELVDIPRTGSLAQLPVELQLEIFFNLDYWDLQKVSGSCRYYRHFVSKTMLDDARERTIDRFKEIERQGRLTNNQKPCYTCLQMMHHTKFHDPNASSSTSGTTATTPKPPTPPIGSRYCIKCGLKNNKFKPGQGITSAGQTSAICKHCKRFQRKPVETQTLRQGYACRSCDREVIYLQENGPILRFVQAVFAVVIFALACSGKAVPRSSHMSHGTWRWIYTISLVRFLVFLLPCFEPLILTKYPLGSLHYRRMCRLLAIPKRTQS